MTTYEAEGISCPLLNQVNPSGVPSDEHLQLVSKINSINSLVRTPISNNSIVDDKYMYIALRYNVMVLKKALMCACMHHGNVSPDLDTR